MAGERAKYIRVVSIQAAYWFVLSMLLAPVPGLWDSWISFGRGIALRLPIVLLLAAASALITTARSVENYRITPAPPAPPSDPSVPAEIAPPDQRRSKQRPRLSLEEKMVLAVGAAAFLLNLISDSRKLGPAGFTPRFVLDVGGIVLGSSGVAIFSMAALMWLTRPRIPANGQRVATPLTRGKRLKRRAIQIAALILVAAGLWCYNTPWWDRFLQSGCAIFCWLCFLVLWMPKSNDQPELLHVVPAGPPDQPER
jgi:hypothetical protein